MSNTDEYTEGPPQGMSENENLVPPVHYTATNIRESPVPFPKDHLCLCMCIVYAALPFKTFHLPAFKGINHLFWSNHIQQTIVLLNFISSLHHLRGTDQLSPAHCERHDDNSARKAGHDTPLTMLTKAWEMHYTCRTWINHCCCLQGLGCGGRVM